MALNYAKWAFKAVSIKIESGFRLPTKNSAMYAAKEKKKSTLVDYLDTSASIFLVINPNHSVELINRKGCEILGYGSDEIVGKDWFHSCIPKSEQRKLAQFFDQIMDGVTAPPDIYENWVLAKGKKRKLIQWRNSLLKDEQGNVQGLISSGIDITELSQSRKHLEEHMKSLELKVKSRTKELEGTIQQLVATNLTLEDQIAATELAEKKYRESQLLINAVVENFPRGAIIVFDSQYEVTYIGGEELKPMGLQKSDFVGVHIDDLPYFSEAQKRTMKRDVRKTLSGIAISSEIEFKGQNYTVNTKPLYSGDHKIIWALVLYSNVTGQKQVQHQLEKALLAERELNELKSRFISMASHEFRTPLSVILSSATLIGKLNGTNGKEHRRKHVARIRTNVNNLVVILNDFLSLDKLDEGKLKVDPKTFELIKFIKLMVEAVEPTKKPGQKIELQHEENNIIVYLDPKLLSHILINLIGNALKYSGEDTTIDLKISSTPEEVTIMVCDTGMGIPQDEQKHLFKRFFRASNATNIQGTGLGLHIVKQYTELMDGHISYVSVPDEGTTFTLKLPLKIKTNEKNTTH